MLRGLGAIATQVVPVRDALWATITPETADNDAEVWRMVAMKDRRQGSSRRIISPGGQSDYPAA